MVPREGLEPSRPYGHRFLRPDRIPIPTPRHKSGILFQGFFGMLHKRLDEIEKFHREDIFRRRALARRF